MNIPRLILARIKPVIPAIAKNIHRKKGMIGENLVNDISIGCAGLKVIMSRIMPRSAKTEIIRCGINFFLSCMVLGYQKSVPSTI